MTGLTSLIDHTLLKPDATRQDVAQLVVEGIELGVHSVCVSPSMLPLPLPADASLRVTAVCGFPSGKHSPEIKAAEAARSVAQGADEIDMVIDLGAALEGRFEDVEAEIRAVREAIPSATLKVIVESAALADEQLLGACRAAVRAGADFVKTSTGFHPAGGASVHAVALMAEAVGPALGVKASGGIRTAAQARAMLAAGATRLGVSGTRALVSGEGSPGGLGY
jgi:deoxyribose-phosphate aldolase